MRLTYRDGTVPHINEKGNYVAAYSDRAMRDVINKLAAYEDAEEQGRLVILPCKVGTEVWRVNFDKRRRQIEPLRFDVNLYLSFNKTVFLTREEAEAALKGEQYAKKR